jgi:hypothetical protein
VIVTEYSREEIRAALDQRLVYQDADDWDAFGLTFTPDAVYVEHHEGTFEGRETILAWLVPVMDQCKGWTFPIEWVVIEGNRVVYKWQNRLPGSKPDGTFYEFGGVTICVYAGNGTWSYQEDIYNFEETMAVVTEWAKAQS